MQTREDIIRRIKALSDRTVDRGCTEQEAMSAADILAKLLNQHGLAMSDIQIKERQDCEESIINTGRKRAHEIQSCLISLAELYDCKVWKIRGSFTFFGFPEDLVACQTLYAIIYQAINIELANHKLHCRMDFQPTGKRESHDFKMGMVIRIANRLRAMKREQQQDNQQATGRDLVVVKSAVVNAAFAVDHNWGNRKGQASKYHYSESFRAGNDAGGRVNLNKSIAGG